MVSSLLLGGLTDEFHLGVRERLSVHVAVGGAPDERVVVHKLVDVSGAARPAVGQNTARANDPLLAVLAPERLREAALGVEDPRADAARTRIPPDPDAD